MSAIGSARARGPEMWSDIGVLGPGSPASCTRPSGWCQAADRREAAECAVAASSVVVLDPRGKGGGALVVAGEDLAVGPFGGQRAVEPFDLAVLPRAVRLDEL